MQKANLINNMLKNGFILAVLLHLLIFLFLIIVVQFQHPETYKKPPQLYIPSYVYRGSITPSVIQSQHSVLQQAKHMPTRLPQPAHNTQSIPLSTSQQQSVMDMSRQFFQQNNARDAQKNSREQEPILLVGDPNESPDPLIRLVGKALSANFNYPRMEGTFGIQGRVYVHMLLHPEGYFSDVRIVQSSENNNFDAAALYAINRAPRVVGADQFISKPKPLLIGFIFN
jgi:TonB family protein